MPDLYYQRSRRFWPLDTRRLGKHLISSQVSGPDILIYASPFKHIYNVGFLLALSVPRGTAEAPRGGFGNRD